MISSFDGSSSKRKKVDFSGKSKKRTTTQILKSAEKTRVQREILIKQRKAAVLIQAAWRQTIDKKKTVSVFSEELNVNITSIHDNNFIRSLRLFHFLTSNNRSSLQQALKLTSFLQINSSTLFRVLADKANHPCVVFFQKDLFRLLSHIDSSNETQQILKFALSFCKSEFLLNISQCETTLPQEFAETLSNDVLKICFGRLMSTLAFTIMNSTDKELTKMCSEVLMNAYAYVCKNKKNNLQYYCKLFRHFFSHIEIDKISNEIAYEIKLILTDTFSTIQSETVDIICSTITSEAEAISLFSLLLSIDIDTQDFYSYSCFLVNLMTSFNTIAISSPRVSSLIDRIVKSLFSVGKEISFLLLERTCILLSTFCRSKSVKDIVLNAVCVSSNFIYHGFTVLFHGNVLIDQIDNVITSRKLTPHFNILSFWTFCMCHVFRSVSDDDLFLHKQRAEDTNTLYQLTAEEYESIVTPMKKIVVKLYLNDSPDQHLLDNVSNFLAFLYDKWTRTPFCHSTLWYDLSLHLAQGSAEFDSPFSSAPNDQTSSSDIPFPPSTIAMPFLAIQPNLFASLSLNESSEIVDLFPTLQTQNRRRYSHPDNSFPKVDVSEKTRLLLKKLPFIVSFSERYNYFYSTINTGRERARGNVVVKVRRDHVFQDSFAGLSNRSIDEMRSNFRIVYYDEFGIQEAGIDGGGLYKDFMTRLLKDGFDPASGLFKTCVGSGDLYPSTSQFMLDERLPQYHFLGLMLAKCIHDGLIIELPLASFFLSKLTGNNIPINPVNHLKFLDPELAKNLQKLQQMDNPEELDLSFVVDEDDFGQIKSYQLAPNGKNTPVTKKNVNLYIYLLSNFYVVRIQKEQMNAFSSGFFELIPQELTQLFSPSEFSYIISGSNSGVDLVDWRSHTKYSGAFKDDHPVIERFWRCVERLTIDEQSKLLFFTTSCSKPPLRGFEFLYPPFTIMPSIGDNTRLPTASTCASLLKLPLYETDSLMLEKLRYAISSDSGFGFS